MRFALLFLLSLCLTACATREREVGATCHDASDCTVEAGLLAACIERECKSVACFSSSDCTLGNWCSTEDQTYDCVEGCQSNLDCPAGENCSDDQQCVAYGCRSTALDCEVGEVCNAGSGQCEAVGGLHCAACEQTEWLWDDQGTLDFCDDEWLGHDGCGGVGQLCIGFEGVTGTFCSVGCEDALDCPRGYSCRDVPLNFDTSAQCGFDISAEPRVCISDYLCDLP